MDKLKRTELFSVIADDQVSEEDALHALKAALSMYTQEADDLMNKAEIREAQGMLSGRHKKLRDDIYNVENL